MKPVTEIRSLKRELNQTIEDRDYWRAGNKKWENAFKAAELSRIEWEDRFDRLLNKMPKVAD